MIIENKKRIFAIYLPQFHPFEENDIFWGKGFTEWHNVARAKSLFPGHLQPHLPTELGFYDLRVPKVMELQSKLAEENGVDGFMFYHYWFNGSPLMNIPLDNYREIAASKISYFFCWANENWTRRWDGKEEHILLKQEYNRSDDEKHIDYLLPFFNDEKYVKINNCPVLAVYRPSHIPYCKEWVDNVRELMIKRGFPGIYLIYVYHLQIDEGKNIQDTGFDAGLVFQPSWPGGYTGAKSASLTDKIGKLLHLAGIRKQLPVVYRHNLIDYAKHVTACSNAFPPLPFKYYPSVCPMWDNVARRKNKGATIFINSTPAIFKKWLLHCYQLFVPFSKEENFIFINAWNEWAEGNYLEPSDNWGRQYLEAVKEVASSASA